MRKPSLSDCHSTSNFVPFHLRPISDPNQHGVSQLAHAHGLTHHGSAAMPKSLQRRIVADPRYSSGAITSALITALLLGAMVTIGILQCISSLPSRPSLDGYSALTREESAS